MCAMHLPSFLPLISVLIGEEVVTTSTLIMTMSVGTAPAASAFPYPISMLFQLSETQGLWNPSTALWMAQMLPLLGDCQQNTQWFQLPEAELKQIPAEGPKVLSSKVCTTAQRCWEDTTWEEIAGVAPPSHTAFWPHQKHNADVQSCCSPGSIKSKLDKK